MRRAIILLSLVVAVVVAVVVGGYVTCDEVRAWASLYNTDPEVPGSLLSALAYVESSYDPEAVNECSGAAGLFQFKEITVLDVTTRLKYPFDPMDPEAATVAAKIYLSWLMRVFGSNNTVLVLTAWHWGSGNTQKLVSGEVSEVPYSTVWFLNKVFRRMSYEKDLAPSTK